MSPRRSTQTTYCMHDVHTHQVCLSIAGAGKAPRFAPDQPAVPFSHWRVEVDDSRLRVRQDAEQGGCRRAEGWHNTGVASLDATPPSPEAAAQLRPLPPAGEVN